MRVTIVSAEYPPSKSGEAANTFFLAQMLASQGIEVSVITRTQPINDRLQGVAVFPVMRTWNWRSAGRLVSQIKRTGPDAVLLMFLGAMYDFHPMITFLPDFLRKNGLATRFVARFENPMSRAQPYDMRFLDKAYWKLAWKRGSSPGYGTLLRKSDSVIALCDHHANLLRKADASVNRMLHVIPPPCNVRLTGDPELSRETGRESLSAAEGEVLLGYMGYIYAQKGVDTLLRALGLLRERGARYRLIVMGGSVGLTNTDNDYFAQMQQLASVLGIDDQVHWLGSFNPDAEATANLIRAIDLFILPFDKGVHLNNSSVASLMTFGKPLISTRSEHADMSIEESGGAAFVDARNPAMLADEIHRIAQDPGLLRSMGERAKSFANHNFAWESCLQKTLDCLGIESS